MKLLILGIDALDRELLDKFADNLPNFSALRSSSQTFKVKSTFPPDSDTAWATIVTGLNPAQHGIVRFIDPLEKSYQILNKSFDNTILHGNTFWEIAAQHGFKTCAVFPHLCHPLWESPAVMVVRGSSVADVQANPPELLREYPHPELLMGVHGFPERSLKSMQAYYRRLSTLAAADAEYALRLLKEQEWDLFFAYWSTIDAIGHFFWNYHDPEDPHFVQGHPLQDAILKTYQLYDSILGQFLESIDKGVPVIVMSDHGHGARPFKLVNVNEVLRQAGFLSSRDLHANPHIHLLEKGKRLAVRTISRYGLGRIAARVMRNFPTVVQSFTRPAAVNWEKTQAFATDMSGIKAYTYGGINLNRLALNGRKYEQTRSEVIALVKRACVLPDGTSLVRFIAPREELYSGPFIERFPDIVLEFEYGYGIGWALNTPLITQADSYNLVPGSHRGDTGTFIIRNQQQAIVGEINLVDVSPTILGLCGVANERRGDGKNVLIG